MVTVHEPFDSASLSGQNSCFDLFWDICWFWVTGKGWIGWLDTVMIVEICEEPTDDERDNN
jgi:hypothetical protein